MRQRYRIGFVWLVLGLMACQGVGLAASGQLLSNPGFELQKEGEMAPGWQLFGSTGTLGQELRFEKDTAYEGQWALVIYDDSATLGYGLRSEVLPAKAGQVYRSAVMGAAESGRGMLYLDYWNAGKKRIGHKTAYIDSPEWKEVEASLEAPVGTEWVSVILYSPTTDVSVVRFDNVSLQLLSD